MEIFNFKGKKQERLQDRVEVLLSGIVDAVELTKGQLPEGKNTKDYGYGSVTSIVNAEVPIVFDGSLANYDTNVEEQSKIDLEYKISNGQLDKGQEIIDSFEKKFKAELAEKLEFANRILGAQKTYEDTPEDINSTDMMLIVETLNSDGGVVYTTRPDTVYEQLSDIKGRLDNLSKDHVPLPENTMKGIDKALKVAKRIRNLETYTGSLSSEVVKMVRMSEL